MTKHVLFCGLGGVGQRHLRNLRSLLGDEVRVSAYRVRRESRQLTDGLSEIAGGNVEQAHGVEAFSELERALEQKPDMAIIANPTSLHVPVALQALDAGCDLFIEKPISHTLESIEVLEARAREKERVCMVAYQLPFDASVEAPIQALDDDMCGTVYGARAEVAEYLPGFHPYEDYRRMYASRRDQGGGVILTQIHEIDLLYRLLGMPESVWCVGGQLSDLEIDVEDSASSLLRYRRRDGKSLAVVLHQDYLGRPPRRSLSVWGERGRLELDLRAGTLCFCNVEGTTQCLVDASAHPRNQLFLDELSHFLECVAGRKSPCVSLNDGAQSLRIALALLNSQSTGDVVSLDEHKPFST